jgi:predicted transcriptional regulator
MKRLQIRFDEDLDAALGKLAAAEGQSKAALIRRFVREGCSPCRTSRLTRCPG